MRSFVKKNPRKNGEITLSITNKGKGCPSRDFFKVARMSFNAFQEIKILAKISGFTVHASIEGSVESARSQRLV